MSPYGGTKPADAGGEAVLTELGDDEIRRPDGHPENDKSQAHREEGPRSGRRRRRCRRRDGATSGGAVRGTVERRRRRTAHRAKTDTAALRSRSRTRGSGGAHRDAVQADGADAARDQRVATGDQKMKSISQGLVHSDKTIVIEGYADANRNDGARATARNDRANIVRNQLIDRRRRARAHPDRHPRRRRQRRARAAGRAGDAGRRAAGRREGKQADADAQPVGESHFANPMPMTVEKGSSGDGVDGAPGDRRRGRVPLRRRERARQRSLRVPRGAVPQPDRLDARDRPGHGLRRRAVHRRRPHRADSAEVVRGRAVRARSPDRHRAQRRRGQQAVAPRHAPARRADRRGPAHPPPEADDHEPAAADGEGLHPPHREQGLEAARGAARVRARRRCAPVRGRPQGRRDQGRRDRRGDADGAHARSQRRRHARHDEGLRRVAAVGTPELKAQLEKVLGDPQEADRPHARSRPACIAGSTSTASAWTSCTARS